MGSHCSALRAHPAARRRKPGSEAGSGATTFSRRSGPDPAAGSPAGWELLARARGAAAAAAEGGGSEGQEAGPSGGEEADEGAAAAAAGAATAHSLQPLHTSSPWLAEAAAFAATYNRFMDRSAVLGPRAAGILREALPLQRTLRQGQQPRQRGGGGGGGGGASGGSHGPGSAGFSTGSGSGSGGSRSYGVGRGRPQPPPGGSAPGAAAASSATPAAGAGPAATAATAQLRHVRQYHSGGAGVSGGQGVALLLRQCRRLLPAAQQQHLFSTCLRRFRFAMLLR